MLVCDGLKGLPDAVGAVWEKTIVQTCIVHLLQEFVQVCVEERLGADSEGPQARLHCRVRGGSARPVGVTAVVPAREAFGVINARAWQHLPWRLAVTRGSARGPG